MCLLKGKKQLCLQAFSQESSGEGHHIKMMEVLFENFAKTPKRYQDPAWWAWLQIFFTLQRHQF